MSCKQCGGPMPARDPGIPGRTPLYCTKRCRDKAARDKRPKDWRTDAVRARNRDRKRAHGRSDRYGIAESVGLELRDRPCDICGREQGTSAKAHAIDHCHETGAVRGALCAHCNQALGMFRDSPELLARAIHYLTRGADYRAVDREA